MMILSKKHKTLKKISWLLCLFLVVSCNDSNVTNSNSNSVAPFNSKWGEELGGIIEKNFQIDLPYIECSSFEFEDTIDDYGDPLIIIYCQFDSEEKLDSSPTQYASICENEGYEVTFETIGTTIDGVLYTYECYFADKVISNTQGIELQFLIGSNNGKDCLGIFAFTYDYYDQNVWPSDLVSNYLNGKEIPKIEGEGFTYNYWSLLDSNNSEYIELVIYGTTKDSELDYYNVLIENDYLIDSSKYEENGYIAISNDKTIGLSFYYDDSYYNGLVIYVYNLAAVI